MIKSLRFSVMIFVFFCISSVALAQTQRNPVLEYCTGTWCPSCPSGHSVINNTILPNIPNAIIIGYHGPADGSDPFSYFPGNNIIYPLLNISGTTYYPSGTIDRTSGVQFSGAWYGYMNTRNSVPATVAIDVQRSFNKLTREFNASIDFTALTTLNGQYKFYAILLESGMVWSQAGGTSNYVHNHVVRAMMNGYLGEEVINGTWNENDVINKTVNYTVPVPGGPGPDIIWDSCDVVVMVYKEGSPININAEIQQAIQFLLVNPDYSATIVQSDDYYFGASTQTAEYSAYIKNTGLLSDTYNISLLFDGPTGWSQTFTTVNGTFNLGETDTLTLNPGDSTEIQVSVSGNSINGFGKTKLQFYSEQGPFGRVEYRFTTFGLNILVVDDDGGETYENYIESELVNLTYEYGIIPSDFIPQNVGNLNTFNILFWNTADTEPGISTDEMNALVTFLDDGGNLYLNGVDLAYQMADPTSPYYTSATHSFFNNYLHSLYVLKEHSASIAVGIDGDPITDSLAMLRLTGGTGANTINHGNGKYVNQISANGTDAYNILHLWLKPDEYAGVRAVHNGMSGAGKVVFTAFGFETISDEGVRLLFAERVVNWLASPTSVEEDPSLIQPVEFALFQNFPNPFNPTTSIKFSVSETSPVTIKVFDVLGNEVAVLLDEVKSAGTYKITYDASYTASGIYFYQMKAGNFISVKKMSILK